MENSKCLADELDTMVKISQKDMIRIKELEAEKNCLLQEIHEQRRLSESYRNTIAVHEKVIEKLLGQGW